MDKLKQLIEIERQRNPKEFSDAESKGELSQYLENALRYENIHPMLLKQYCKAQVSDNEFLYVVDSFVPIVSFNLDKTIYEAYYRYENNITSNKMVISDFVSSFHTNSNVSEPLNDLKIFSAFSSLVFLNKGRKYGMRPCLPQFICLGISADLLRISYNCYSPKYCSLYLNMIGGNLSKVTGTIFNFAKSVVGSDHKNHPLYRLTNEILWENLFEDTITQKIYRCLKKL